MGRTYREAMQYSKNLLTDSEKVYSTSDYRMLRSASIFLLERKLTSLFSRQLEAERHYSR